MEVNLNASVYGNIPKIPEMIQGHCDSYLTGFSTLLAVLTGAFVIIFVRKRKGIKKS